jgi:pimeloyl-ACP methyl ester carboxylesterase
MANPVLAPWQDGGLGGWRGRGDLPPILAIAGPPTSGLLFRHLETPLAKAGRPLWIVEPFHPAPPSGRLPDLADRIAAITPKDAVVVGHGLGVPLAIEVAARARPRGLCLLDGPIERMDPVSSAMVRVARVVPGVVAAALRPGPALTLFASSIGLRRAVNNPYAMDRDTVAMLLLPVLVTPAHRRAVSEYLGSLPTTPAPHPLGGTPVLLAWGSSDLLYPVPGEPSRWFPGSPVQAITFLGGRYLNVEERPWEVAEAILGWLSGLDGR